MLVFLCAERADQAILTAHKEWHPQRRRLFTGYQRNYCILSAGDPNRYLSMKFNKTNFMLFCFKLLLPVGFSFRNK